MRTSKDFRPDSGRQIFAYHLGRLWSLRHEPPRLLPNGRDWTDVRASIRSNLRGQRSAAAYEAQEARELLPRAVLVRDDPAPVGSSCDLRPGRTLGDPRPMTYVYVWGNNARRAELKGRLCEIEVEGRTMNTVLIRFLDTGERVTTSRYALRPEPPNYQPPLTPALGPSSGLFR